MWRETRGIGHDFDISECRFRGITCHQRGLTPTAAEVDLTRSQVWHGCGIQLAPRKQLNEAE
jgi:hypothetical protein